MVTSRRGAGAQLLLPALGPGVCGAHAPRNRVTDRLRLSALCGQFRCSWHQRPGCSLHARETWRSPPARGHRSSHWAICPSVHLSAALARMTASSGERPHKPHAAAPPSAPETQLAFGLTCTVTMCIMWLILYYFLRSLFYSCFVRKKTADLKHLCCIFPPRCFVLRQ